MKLDQMVDRWQGAIEGRRMWDVPDDLAVLLDAPLSSESVVEFARHAYKAIQAARKDGRADLARRLDEAIGGLR